MKKIYYIILLGILLIAFSGCTQADKVSYNLSQESDNFNVVRKLTVMNCIANDILFQMEGKISIKADNTDNQLEITVEDENGQYQKHFIGLSDNVTYVIEQTRAKNTDRYKYILNYNPKMWLPVKVQTID